MQTCLPLFHRAAASKKTNRFYSFSNVGIKNIKYKKERSFF